MNKYCVAILAKVQRFDQETIQARCLQALAAIVNHFIVKSSFHAVVVAKTLSEQKPLAAQFVQQPARKKNGQFRVRGPGLQQGRSQWPARRPEPKP